MHVRTAPAAVPVAVQGARLVAVHAALLLAVVLPAGAGDRTDLAAGPPDCAAGDAGRACIGEWLRPLALRAAGDAVAPPDRFEPTSYRFAGADPLAGRVESAELLEADGPNRSGVVRLAFRLVAGGAPAGVARATVRGTVRGPALVTARAVRGGAAIGAADAAVADVDLTRLVGTPVRGRDELVDRVALRTLGAGRAITRELLAPRPVVRQGDPVDLEVRRAGLVITARGRALRDGAPGERIPAEYGPGRTLLLAEVMPDGSLRVVREARGGSR